MQTFVYVIPEIPPTLNKFLGRENSWEYRNTKAKWLKKISLCCTPKPRKPLEKAVVTLFFHFKDKRRRDLDNYLKFVLDGLTAAGIIRDDNFETIELRLKGTADKKGILPTLYTDGRACQVTNERLAELIREGGNDELLPLLWDKTRLLIYKKCSQYWGFYSAKLERFGYSLDDLRQESYNALTFAVNGYKSEKGYKFTAYLTYALKRVIRDMLSGGSDVLNQPGTQSLEQPLGENSEGNPLLVGDVVPDERAAAVYEDIDRLDEYNVLYEAIDSLPDVERRVIIEHYFKGFTFTKIGRLHDFTRSRAEQAHKRAIWLLRRGQTGRKLFDLYGSGSKCNFDGSIRVPKHKSVQAFKRSHTSEVEDYVLWLLSKDS